MRGITDYPPGGLTETQSAVWEAVYQASMPLYGYQWAGHVSSKIVDDLWTRSGRSRTLTKPRVIPNPGNMVWLGYTISLQYFDPRSREIIVRKHFPPLTDCLWSPKLQAVMVYPGLRIPPASMMPETVPKLLKIYQDWHDGKYPKNGVSRVNNIPGPRVRKVYPAAAIVYRSDKFDADGEWVDYIHHHDDGGDGRPGPMVYDGGTAWMLRGGRLVLTPDGLDH